MFIEQDLFHQQVRSCEDLELFDICQIEDLFYLEEKIGDLMEMRTYARCNVNELYHNYVNN